MDNRSEMLQLCRLCLVKDDVNIPIFEEQGDIRQIFLKISSCLPVKVSREDKLPQKICDGCSYKLDMLYEFWNTTANAEKQLLSWLGEAGMNSKMADGTMSAVAQQIKPVETFVKQEAIDPSDIHTEENDDDKSYMFQDKFTADEAGPSATVTPNAEEEEEEEPPPKRARRTAAVKAQIAMDPESDDDDDDSGEPMTKIEDESEDSEGDDHESSFVDVPSTSADDQPGPSGVGKDGVEAPTNEISKCEKAPLRKIIFMCKTCKRLFSTPNKLKQHLDNIVVKITYFCPPCDGYFDKDHPCNLSGKRCAYCKKLLDTKYLKNHICFHKAEEQIICNYCQVEIKGMEQLNHSCKKKKIVMNHIKENNLACVDVDCYLCKICGERLELSKVILHMITCLYNEEKSRKKNKCICKVCTKSFGTDYDLLNHREGITPKVIFFCKCCVKFFNEEDDHNMIPCKIPLICFCVICRNLISKSRYLEHICFHISTEEQKSEYHKMLLDDERFVSLCDTCGKQVPVKLKSDHKKDWHETSIIKVTEYNCNICKIKFTDSIAYKKHRRTHENKLLCHICGKSMASYKMVGHMNAHYDSRNYKCTKCDKAFYRRYQLRKHMLVHSDVAKYQCTTCGKRFKCRFNCRVHMRIHAEVKPFECVVCKKTFTTKQWRDNHLKTHNVLEVN